MWKGVNFTQIFSVAAELKALAASRLRALSNPLGIKPFYVIFGYFFYILKQVPMYFSYLGEHCFNEKLQKCFADHKTSPEFPSARRR